MNMVWLKQVVHKNEYGTEEIQIVEIEYGKGNIRMLYKRKSNMPMTTKDVERYYKILCG